MSSSINFVRVVFTIVCTIFSVLFFLYQPIFSSPIVGVGIGFISGLVISSFLFFIDMLLSKTSLRTFNQAILGLFVGYLLATALLAIAGGFAQFSEAGITGKVVTFAIYLVSIYLGLIMVARAAGEFHLSIPFVELKESNIKKKDILIDTSILTDPRIIDLASTGLLDHHLVMARFSLKELQAGFESSDEGTKSKARKALDVLKKLESMPSLDLRYVDIDFPEIKDDMSRLVQVARFLDTNIITSDINRIQQSTIEGVGIINIHMLSHALKPLSQTGETIHIKIQRYGKEPRQGVGYLDDGTMVVVNGGAEFIGETIKGYVLSVKHTSSGRMIFCNAAEEAEYLTDLDHGSEPSYASAHTTSSV